MGNVTHQAIVYNIDRPRAMNAEAIVDSQNYRILLYVVGWVCCLNVCPFRYIYGRRNDIRSLYISSKREK